FTAAFVNQQETRKVGLKLPYFAARLFALTIDVHIALAVDLQLLVLHVSANPLCLLYLTLADVNLLAHDRLLLDAHPLFFEVHRHFFAWLKASRPRLLAAHRMTLDDDFFSRDRHFYLLMLSHDILLQSH